MTLALLWNPRAREDRAAIMDYIGQDNPVAALELDELRFHDDLELLERHRAVLRLVGHPQAVDVRQVEGDVRV